MTTRTFFRSLILATFALGSLTACQNDGSTAPVAPVVVDTTPKYAVVSFYLMNPDVTMLVGESQQIDVELVLDGAATSIPTASFVAEVSVPSVGSVASISFTRTDRYNSQTGKPETVFRQSYRVQALKAGVTQLSVTHVLAPKLQVAANVQVLQQLMVKIGASPSAVFYGGSTKIEWTSAGATACWGTEGANGWNNGNRELSSATPWSTGPLWQTTFFGITCTNGRQNYTAYVVVYVT